MEQFQLDLRGLVYDATNLLHLGGYPEFRRLPPAGTQQSQAQRPQASRINNTKKNLPHLEAAPFHFVGSLTPSHHPNLLAVGKAAYVSLHEPRLGGVSAYRTKKEVFGVERTIVITYNEALYLGQKQGLLIQQKKANDLLSALQLKVMTAWEKGKKECSSQVVKPSRVLYMFSLCDFPYS